jgi:hypothetical protein
MMAPTTAKAARLTPTPIPAWAPVLRPEYLSDAGDGVGVAAADVIWADVVEATAVDVDVDDDDGFGNDTVAATLYVFVAEVGTADHFEGATAEKVSFVVVPLQLPSPQQAQRLEVVL